MKRMLAMLACLVLAVGMFGCGTVKTETETVDADGFSKVWVASDDDVAHETGQMTVDDAWGAVMTQDSPTGALVKTEVDLKPTAYTMVARLAADNVSAGERMPAGALRAVAQDGTVIGSEVVRVNQFATSMTYQDFSLTFRVPAETKVTLEVYWPGYNYLRCARLGVMSKATSALPDYGAQFAALLAPEEESLTYDAEKLYYFDLLAYTNAAPSDELAYDLANLVATLQGLVNRDGSHLFVKFTTNKQQFNVQPDEYWLNKLQADGEMLADRELVTVKNPATLLALFKDFYQGYAAWDPEVPATVNAVATACGVEDLLPLRYSPVTNSLYHYLANLDADRPVKVNLGEKFTGEGKIFETDLESTGSRKNDAYLWAKAKYLDTGKTSSTVMAYHVDAYSKDLVCVRYPYFQNMFLANRDYYVAEKAFFFDLSVVPDENPNDDPDVKDYNAAANDSIDFKTLTTVLTAQNKRAGATPINIGGFHAWQMKYSKTGSPDSKYGDVAVEWLTVRTFSTFNAMIDADAPGLTSLANASLYRQYPLDDRYVQKGVDRSADAALPGAEDDGTNYLLIYMGDYDSSAWLTTSMAQTWDDPKRGEIPLCWPFAPDMEKRAPQVLDYLYANATENDYFVAGDNGLGYLNPESYLGGLRDEFPGLNGSLDEWVAACKKKYDKYGLVFQGFLISDSGKMNTEVLNAYAKIVKGIAWNVPTGSTHSVGECGIVSSIDAGDNVAAALGRIKSASIQKSSKGKCTFTSYRFILWSPTQISELKDLLDKETDYKFEIVDPYSFYKLNSQYFQA